MKKFIKRILLTLTLMLANMAIVNAAGSLNATFGGSSTGTVGSNVSLNISVSNVTGSADGKVYAFGGNVIYDAEYLQYVSFTGANSWTASTGTASNGKIKISSVDFSMSNGITSGNVGTITFKVLKTGTTTVTMNTIEATDQGSNLTVSFTPKSLTLENAKSSDNKLKSLGVTGYTLSPSFNANTTSYTVTIPRDVTQVTVTAEANDSKATVTGKGTVNITGETTTATVKVTAENGSSKNYTISIKKQAAPSDPTPSLSSDNKLKSLGVTGYTLSPSFDPSTNSYTVTIPRDVTQVTVTAEANDSKATVTGTGSVAISGESTSAIVKVVAENGSANNYTITIKKEAAKEEEKPVETTKGSDATLKSLDVSGYTLSPAFSSATTSYSMKVGNGITGLKVTAIPTDSNAKASVSGNSKWVVGNNVITITVTAEDGTTKQYTVNVTRANANVKSSDTNLDFKILTPHVITPNYSNSVNDYNVVVSSDVSKLEFDIVPYDKKTTYTVSGNSNFTIGGDNKVTVLVTAEDGTKRTITINVTLTEEKPNTDLLDLAVKGYEIDPKFDPSVSKYSVDVDSKTKKLDLIVKAPEGSKYEVTGNDDFKDGKNVVLIKVTDQKGFSKYYEIDAYKKVSEFPWMWIILGLLGLAFLVALLLLLFLFKNRKKEEEPSDHTQPINIDFKPEFNFNSKNGTDDDVLYSKGDINAGTSFQKSDRPKELNNPYDAEVTKDEIIDALNERDPEKLKILLEQEKLNRQKEEMKKRETR